WGHSENAVNIHIWIAISTYLIVAKIKKDINSSLSIYEIIQILGISVCSLPRFFYEKMGYAVNDEVIIKHYWKKNL
ncbi:MAG: hypothetical protein O9316_02230, partial [Flavobacterium sp.]|nr:hypothetical protein [Flavobacterium sp.]MCZ8366231.1 hypothetical protein [Flavobacterium sp.]